MTTVSTDDLRSFKKLNGKNYPTWAYTAKQRFIKKGIWPDIDPAKTPETQITETDGTVKDNPKYESWLQVSTSRIPDLVELVDEALIPQIMNAGSATEQWVILEQRYQATSQLSQSTLRAQFYSLQLRDASKASVDTFLGEYDNIVAQLALAGAMLGDDECFSRLSTAMQLVPAYATAIETMQTSMRNAPATIDDINFLLNIIRQCAEPDVTSPAPGAAALASFAPGKCFACGHPGHRAAECPNVTPEMRTAATPR
jgi:hypothetical protein